MKSRRDLILEEMGLTPVWRLRGTVEDPPLDASPLIDVQPASIVERRSAASEQRGTRDQKRETRNEPPLSGAGDRRSTIMSMDWPALKARVASCTDCPLHQRRTKTVFGVGDENADWLFVGEGPGAEEDARGEPFVGQAGRLLDNMLPAVGLQRGKGVYIANCVKCLRYNALVQLGDGSWERIGRLVASRYSGDVISLDETGTLVRRRVTAWHATPLAGRRVFRLSYASHKAAGISKCNVQLTGDHPVMTDRGWVAVQDLRQGDRIATGQGLSETAFDVICGTLLGDGHIETSSARFSLGHSERQSEYLHLKAELLAELDCHVDSLAVAARAGATRRYQALHLRTKAHRALAILRSQFYAAKKRVPSWMETRLNDRMLAFWFMDDGYMRIRTNRQPRAEIATCAFSEQDIQRLLHGLANLGIPAKALRGRIHLDVQATRKLSERIAPFVPPMMRHKLHPDVARSIPYDPERLIVGTAQVLYDEAEATEIIHSGTDQTFYCLDIEDTHNFVTSGGVVHNCRPPGNRNPEPGEALQCEPYLHRQIELIRPKLIVALGKVAAANLLATDASVASMRGKVHRYRDTPLIVTYHPAYLLRNLPDKAKAWADLCFAVRVMRDLQGGGGAPN